MSPHSVSLKYINELKRWKESPDSFPFQDEFLKACEMALEGVGLRRIARELKMPLRQLQEIIVSNPGRERLFAAARSDGIEALVDDTLDRAPGKSDSEFSTFSGNVKWAAARRKKDIYSEKVEVENSQKVSLLSALEEARGRVSAVEQNLSDDVIEYNMEEEEVGESVEDV